MDIETTATATATAPKTTATKTATIVTAPKTTATKTTGMAPATTATTTTAPDAASGFAARALGWVSLALSLGAMMMIFFGDPYWLALPCSAIGAAVGFVAIRGNEKDYASSHLGFNIGIFNGALWVIVLVVPKFMGL